MKNTVLAMLMVVMVATPCFAQEVEPDELFSIEGTRWKVCRVSLGTWQPFIGIECPAIDSTGFYQGTVYACNGEDSCVSIPEGSYIDLQVVSTYTHTTKYFNLFGILQPGGIGVVTAFINGPDYPITVRIYIGVMFKVDDDWTPLGGVTIDDIEIKPPDDTDPGGGDITVQPIPDLPDYIYDDPSEYQLKRE